MVDANTAIMLESLPKVIPEGELSWSRFFGQILPFLKWRFCLLG